MPKRDVRVRLLHMRDYAREAVAFSEGRTRADLDTDRMLYLSLLQLVQVVGEAASQIPPAERANYPSIPCDQIIGVRNRLIQGYNRVDSDVLWEIVTHDLPPLVAELEMVVATLED